MRARGAYYFSGSMLNFNGAPTFNQGGGIEDHVYIGKFNIQLKRSDITGFNCKVYKCLHDYCICFIIKDKRIIIYCPDI